MGAMSGFWYNLEGLRKIHLLSLDALCKELNEAGMADGAGPIHITKAGYYHYVKRNPYSRPSGRLARLVSDVYCSGMASDITDRALDMDELAFLATGGQCREYPEDPVRLFWENYGYIENAYDSILGYRPWWPHASQYFNKILKSRDRLPPLPVIRDIAERFRLKPYPVVYLIGYGSWGMEDIRKLLMEEAMGGFRSDTRKRAAAGTDDPIAAEIRRLRAGVDTLQKTIDRLEELVLKESRSGWGG